ncbi:TPA: hypothetical protein MAF88_004894 [Klebsiella pneumoniae]|uniref:Uncharacterized protein n=1 Tax=Klebsiella grimontii TaxID=2058152 RepID=A0ABD7AGZ5_9ENTR|nr:MULTISPECIES: hypothetical protein [Klebsiella]AEJ98679.1 hypothetical protein KPN2242_13945 [Klebsiella pneumoniae KCTC 2242]KPO01218.1 hypothetical protein AO842_14175 [Klebsiella sp. AA405]CAH6180994.1 hypothetical protein AN2336V5_2437 [Klebsiella oxytoca]HCT9971558.1 hypothetical protein [Klebsiella variicola]ASK72601.1 hypothetical protein CF000_05515 [Klebsiella michiganensis]
MNLYAFNPLKQNDKQEVITPVAFNLVLSLPEQLLKRLDKVGYELVKRYGIAGCSDKQRHHIAIVHLLKKHTLRLR